MASSAVTPAHADFLAARIAQERHSKGAMAREESESTSVEEKKVVEDSLDRV